MTIAYWCVLAGALMPLIWTGVAKGGRKKMPLSANRNPREFLESLRGYQQRANWAQQNAFEAFPAFAAAVIISHIAGAAAARIDLLALLWIAARLLHGICYVADWSSLRSVFYFCGIGCVIALFLIVPGA